MNTRILKFIVADDQPISRTGIVGLLSTEFEGCIVDAAINGDDLLKAASLIQYDIVFIDITLPQLDGIAVTRMITHTNSKTRVIGLSLFEDAITIHNMLQSGAVACLAKTAPTEEIMHTIMHVLYPAPVTNNRYGNRRLAKSTAQQPARDKNRPTQREMEILRLICQGLSLKEIAGKIHIALRTVQNHRNHLLEKTGMHTTGSLVSFAFRKRWME